MTEKIIIATIAATRDGMKRYIFQSKSGLLGGFAILMVFLNNFKGWEAVYDVYNKEERGTEVWEVVDIVCSQEDELYIES